MTHLSELRVLKAAPIAADFIAQYENARFSTQPLMSLRFRELMYLIAEVLRGMQPFNPAVLHELGNGDSDNDAPSESDVDNDAPLASNSSTSKTMTGRRRPHSNVSRSPSTRAASSRVLNLLGRHAIHQRIRGSSTALRRRRRRASAQPSHEPRVQMRLLRPS
jgi:hypothetical protein